MLTYSNLKKRLKLKRTYIEKSSCTSGDHYLITLTRKDSDKKMQFDFYSNMYTKGNLNDYLTCLAMDRYAYISTKNVEDFAYMFGYDSLEKANHVYRACREISRKMSKFFTRREIQLLYEEAFK